MTHQEVKQFTPFVNIGKECGRNFKFRAEYGFSFLNRYPDFSITGEGMPVNGNIDSPGSFCGCCHDYVEKHCPEIAPLIKWHLCAMVEGPMHYIANALYHFGLSAYEDAYNLDHFKSTIVFGAVEGDEEYFDGILKMFERKNEWSQLATNELAYSDEDENEVNEDKERIIEQMWKVYKARVIKEWLEARKPRLLERFYEDIEKHAPGLWKRALDIHVERERCAL